MTRRLLVYLFWLALDLSAAAAVGRIALQYALASGWRDTRDFYQSLRALTKHANHSTTTG